MGEFAIVQQAMLTGGGPTQDFTSSGFGTPKGAIFFATYGTANGTVVDHAMLLVGATDGTNHRCIAFATEDAQNPSDTGRTFDETVPVITVLNTSQLLDGSASAAFITDGVRLTWSDFPPAAYQLTCILLGGLGISNVLVGHVDANSTLNGSSTVTTGFPTSLVFTFSESQSSQSRPSFGFVTNDGSNTQRSLSSSDQTAVSPTQLIAVLDTASVMRNAAGGGAAEKLEISNFTSTTFDVVTRIAGGVAYRLYYMAIQLSNCSASVVTSASPTATGDDTITGASAKPQFGLMLHSATVNAGTSYTDGNAEVFGVSAFTASTAVCHAIASDDNVATSNSESMTDTKPVRLRKDAADWMTATYSAFTSTGVTFNYSATDTGAAHQRAVLFISEFTALLVNVNDSTAVTDADSARMSRIILSVFDTVTISEADFLQSAVIFSVNVNDSTQVTEDRTIVLRQLNINVFDSTAVTDGGISIAYTQATLAIDVFESVPMFDLVGGIATFEDFLITVFDNVGVNRGAAELDWGANSEPDLAGYRIYQGTTSGVYGPVELPYNGGTADYYDVGNVNTYVVLNLDFGTTYYFVITAYDLTGNESLPSAEVSFTPEDLLPGDIQIDAGAYFVEDDTTITEDVTMNLIVSPSVSDDVFLTENHTLLFPFIAMAPGDLVTVTDGLPTVTLTTLAGLFVSTGDSTTVTDFVNAQFAGIVNVNDTTGITDSSTLMMPVYIRAMAAGQDTTGITDASTASIVLTGNLSVGDAVAVTDAVTIQMSKVLLNVFDSILMSDGATTPPPRLVGPGGNTNVGRLTNIAGTSPETVIT